MIEKNCNFLFLFTNDVKRHHLYEISIISNNIFNILADIRKS